MATVIVIHLALSLSLHEDELPLSKNGNFWFTTDIQAMYISKQQYYKL